MPSERHADKFLKLTVCEKLNVSYAYKTLKENGRSNYFIMYVANGCCTLVENRQELKAEAGSLINSALIRRLTNSLIWMRTKAAITPQRGRQTSEVYLNRKSIWQVYNS